MVNGVTFLLQDRAASFGIVTFTKRITSWLFAAALLVVGVDDSKAAFVTTNEAEMDAIYAQADVDVRFNPTLIINDPNLLNIDTNQKINDLFDIGGGGPTVYMFFVDTIDYCSSFNVAIIGCGQVGGNKVAVESEAAATAIGAELNAHELGHALGLEHVAFPNLMTGSINGNTDLTSAQICTITGNGFPCFESGSPFVQDDGELFVSITPVLITPIPPAGILFLSGILGLAWFRRRNKSADAEQPAAA